MYSISKILIDDLFKTIQNLKLTMRITEEKAHDFMLENELLFLEAERGELHISENLLEKKKKSHRFSPIWWFLIIDLIYLYVGLHIYIHNFIAAFF